MTAAQRRAALRAKRNLRYRATGKGILATERANLVSRAKERGTR